MKKIIIYTDGACRGNPGPGAWACLLSYESKEKSLSGFEALTTNNRMELMASIKALNALKEPCDIDIYTDSKYVQQGMTQWIHNWRKNNWKNAAKQPVKNDDLWKQLDELARQHNIRWNWVKGHAGDIGNETVDRLANQAIDIALEN